MIKLNHTLVGPQAKFQSKPTERNRKTNSREGSRSDPKKEEKHDKSAIQKQERTKIMQKRNKQRRSSKGLGYIARLPPGYFCGQILSSLDILCRHRLGCCTSNSGRKAHKKTAKGKEKETNRKAASRRKQLRSLKEI